MTRSRDVVIQVDEDILRELAAVPDRKGSRASVWTPRQDALLRAGWETKNQEALAKVIGYCTAACRKRYRQLQEADHGNP